MVVGRLSRFFASNAARRQVKRSLGADANDSVGSHQLKELVSTCKRLHATSVADRR